MHCFHIYHAATIKTDDIHYKPTVKQQHNMLVSNEGAAACWQESEMLSLELQANCEGQGAYTHAPEAWHAGGCQIGNKECVVWCKICIVWITCQKTAGVAQRAGDIPIHLQQRT